MSIHEPLLLLAPDIEKTTDVQPPQLTPKGTAWLIEVGPDIALGER